MNRHMKHMKQSAVKWLFDLLRPLWRNVLLSVLLGTLTIASSIGLMMTSAWLISACALHPSIADLGISIVGVRFFGIVRAVFRYLERLVSHHATFGFLAKMRVDFYRAIEPLAPARLSRFQTGDLLGRVVSDVDSLQEVYLRAVVPPLVALITGVGLVALFGMFDWRAAVTVAVFFTLTGIIVPLIIAQASRTAGHALITTRAELNAVLVDGVQGLAEITAYGLQSYHSQQVNRLNNASAIQQRRLHLIDSVSSGAMVFLTSGTALLVLYSALSHVDGIYLASLTLGVFAAFEALMPLPQAARQWDMSMSAARRLQEIARERPVVSDPTRPAKPPVQFDLSIRDLSFRYTPSTPFVLNHLSLTVKSGQHIAILGSSGSGKSTLVNLLARFWDDPNGSIEIGGVRVNRLSQSDAHNLIAILSQQAYLFNTSILENIRVARPDATDEKVIEAARRAQLDPFVAQLPDGYDTFVGENGAAVSGGEHRRIALARILLKDAPIIILDEPTAHLDIATESAILETVFNTLQNQTVILCTHRYTLLDRVDHVYRMDAGNLQLVH